MFWICLNVQPAFISCKTKTGENSRCAGLTGKGIRKPECKILIRNYCTFKVGTVENKEKTPHKINQIKLGVVVHLGGR